MLSNIFVTVIINQPEAETHQALSDTSAMQYTNPNLSLTSTTNLWINDLQNSNAWKEWTTAGNLLNVFF